MNAVSMSQSVYLYLCSEISSMMKGVVWCGLDAATAYAYMYIVQFFSS